MDGISLLEMDIGQECDYRICDKRKIVKRFHFPGVKLTHLWMLMILLKSDMTLLTFAESWMTIIWAIGRQPNLLLWPVQEESFGFTRNS